MAFTCNKGTKKRDKWYPPRKSHHMRSTRCCISSIVH